MSLLPILLLESLDDGTGVGGTGNGVGMNNRSGSHVSVQSLVDIAQSLRRAKGATAATPGATTSIGGTVTSPGSSTNTDGENTSKPKPVSSLHDLEPDMHYQHKPVARGVAGRPREQTPSVSGAASRAHVECPELSVDSLAYWNDPVGELDMGFQSPFRVDNRESPDGANNEHYISFSPDRGGWNNVSHCWSFLCFFLFVVVFTSSRCLVFKTYQFGRNVTTCRLLSEMMRSLCDFVIFFLFLKQCRSE
jgi:hypothetical protein